VGDKGAALCRWLGPGRGERGASDPCTHGGFVQGVPELVPAKTRCRLIYADMHPEPHVATPQDGYARHRDEALAGAFEMCRLMDVDARANLMRIRAGSMMDRNEQESA